MSCWQTIQDYGLRSLGIGERLLPRENFTLCDQFTLIGSGMIWNIYFGIFALVSGFCLATLVALGKASPNPWLRKPSEWFIFVFRGSPLFIQFFFGYFFFLSLKSEFAFFSPFTAAWLGALIVLFLNTAAYSGEIFYGALQSIPKGDVEGGRGSAGSSGRRCCALHGLPIPMRRSFCSTPRHWCFSAAFPPGNSAVTRCIMPAISPIKPLTPLCPTRSLRAISSC
jgi:His/Glu/Gln/Arg/opine family amino acid ABC transporter permease subunit